MSVTASVSNSVTGRWRCCRRQATRPIPSLLDAANGLLFTGDTFYSGEVYLWAPETDMTGEAASIAKLARLAPGLKLLLPAHGPPVAEPAQLLELKKALQDIEAGGLHFETTSTGRRLYKFEHFSILTNASAGKD